MPWLNTQLPAQRIYQPAPARHQRQVQLAPAPQQVKPAPASMEVRVPAPDPQMRVLTSRAGQPALCRALPTTSDLARNTFALM